MNPFSNKSITYDATFMDKALLTAKPFYFQLFLPAVTQFLIVQPSYFSTTTGYQSNSTGDSSSSIASASGIIIGHGSKTICHGSNTTGHGNNTTSHGRNTNGHGSNTTDIRSNTMLWVMVWRRPQIHVKIWNRLQGLVSHQHVCKACLLDHLMLKRHSVKGNGNCLYHAVAHQAGLITASNTGDEEISRQLQHLVVLKMLNYPVV